MLWGSARRASTRTSRASAECNIQAHTEHDGNDHPYSEQDYDTKANGDSINEMPDESSWDDEDSPSFKQSLVAAAMDVWRANIAQYMSKLEIEMISAHGIAKSRTRGFPPRSDDSFFVVLRYGKTMQKTLIAHSRTADPVGTLCAMTRGHTLRNHSRSLKITRKDRRAGRTANRVL